MHFLNNITPDSTNKKGAISHYFATTNCIACNQKSQQGLCVECCNSPQETVAILQNKIRLWERSFHEINRVSSLLVLGIFDFDKTYVYRYVIHVQDIQQICSAFHWIALCCIIFQKRIKIYSRSLM